MNEALEQLYSENWDNLVKHPKDLKAAYPLLIKVSENYKNADFRVMIVGQETDGWIGELYNNDISIKYAQNKYFNYLYLNNNKNKRPFWNRKNFKFFKEELTKKHQTRKVELIWNNVNKIGKISRGKPTKEIIELERKYFNIFNEELNILNPKVIIFTTGDRHIPLKHSELKPIRREPVSQVILQDNPSIYALRTYHPNAKIKGGKKHFKKNVLNLIYQNT